MRLPEGTGYHTDVADCPLFYDWCRCPEAIIGAAFDIVAATYAEPWIEGGEAKIALSKVHTRLVDLGDELV